MTCATNYTHGQSRVKIKEIGQSDSIVCNREIALVEIILK